MTSPPQALSPTDAANNTSPGILGISYLGITVRDIPAAQRFWTSVIGFVTLFDGDELCMIFEQSSKPAIGLTNQQGQVAGSFDERSIRLDHLALAVADIATLHRWERRLAGLDVPHSAITSSDAGPHLNLRAPDNFPTELFVLTDEGAASLGSSRAPARRRAPTRFRHPSPRADPAGLNPAGPNHRPTDDSVPRDLSAFAMQTCVPSEPAPSRDGVDVPGDIVRETRR
jgi:catechol 2,3-dioxygenase-like lactoylglutathione lyase family enzyme